MKALLPRFLPLAFFLVAAGSGCALYGRRAGSGDSSADLPLTPIRAKHRYLTAADLPQTQLRVALVNVALRGEKVGTLLTIGQLRPREGLFKIETSPRRCTSLRMLLEALEPHLDRMPVGLVLTIGGALPGDSPEPPPAFSAFVTELQKELDREEILYVFLLPTELHLVE